MQKNPLCRTWAEVEAHPLVEAVSYEGADGIWVYVVAPYWSPDMECATIHENLREAAKMIQRIEVAPDWYNEERAGKR